jgi:hypothetical protein
MRVAHNPVLNCSEKSTYRMHADYYGNNKISELLWMTADLL